MSSNINPLLAQNRARLAAHHQAQQARANASNQRMQLAHRANQLAAFAAQNPNINPALIFHNYSSMIGIHNPVLQHPNPPQPMWPGQLTFQQVQQINFQRLQQSMVQQPTLQNAVVQNHVLPHVPAIQNIAAVNQAVSSQVHSASMQHDLTIIDLIIHRPQSTSVSAQPESPSSRSRTFPFVSWSFRLKSVS
jgi:hypothetical protein